MIFSKKIILGTANFIKPYGIFKNRVNNKSIKTILNYAKKNNIKFLDTSLDYSNLQKKNYQNFKSFKIFKKIDLNFFKNNKNYTKSISKDLNELLFSRHPCFGVTLRKPNNLLKKKGKEIYKILNNFRSKGKIKKIGITIYNTKNLRNIIKKFRIDYIQIPVNLVNLKIFNSVKKLIKNKKIEIHARSIFLQGLLLKNECELPRELVELRNEWKLIDKKIINLKLSKYSACVNFVLNLGIDKIIIGVDNSNQIKNLLNLKKVRVKIPSFRIKNMKLIDPIYWLKFDKNESKKSF